MQQVQQHQQYLRNSAQVHQPHYYSQPQSQNVHTSVEIQPSRSYEIKQTDMGYRTIYTGDEHQSSDEYQQHQQEVVPVIVLRIPGPQKYASHLQALLQQYLEVRAAQYIQALQEQEAQNHNVGDHQSIQYNAQAIDSFQPMHYQNNDHINAHDYSEHTEQQVQQDYGVPDVQYENQQGYQQVQQIHHQVEQQTEVDTSHEIEPHTEPQLFYRAEGVPESQYQDSYQPSYDEQQQHQHQHHTEVHNYNQQPQEEIIYGTPKHESVSEHNDLLTTENFPSDKHTQVIFKSTTQQPYYHSGVTHGHDIQTYRAPLIYHQLEQFYGNEQGYSGISNEHNYNSGIDGSASEGNYVSITPRTPTTPYNYHAHTQHEQYNDYSTVPTVIRAKSSKRQTQYTEDRYKKFTKLMNRLKQRMTSTKVNDDTQKEQ